VDMYTEQERNPPAATIDSNGVYHFATLNSAGSLVLNPRLNPHFSFLPMAEPGSTSRYNSLQVSLDRRFAKGFQFQVAYTFSHCTDDGSSPLGSISGGNTSSLYENPYLRDPIDKGPCYFNANNNFRVNGVYALPLHGNQLVEGWQLSAILTQMTGLPFSVYDGADLVGYSSSGNPRPNYVAGCDVNTKTVHEWFNPACFSPQTPGTLGNLGRDTVFGPGLAQLDVALVKDTRIQKISEAFRIQFRAEAYNIVNHPQFALPGNSMFTSVKGAPNASAGIISSIAPNSTARQIQLGLKFLF